MSEYCVYLNGQLIPETEAKISIHDRGFILGDAVFDAVRTFNHKLFRLKDHMGRLFRSLRYVYINLELTQKELEVIIHETLAANLHRISAQDDMIVTVRISRGVPGLGPTLLVTCRPVDFGRFAGLYERGLELAIPPIRAVSADTLDPRVKTQSRIVNVLAELQTETSRPGAWPLLCNSRGIITESARANFMIVRDKLILAPKGGRILEGVTATVTSELATRAGYSVEERDLTPYDVLQADEAFVTSTSICILPVIRLNGVPINGGMIPGPVTRELMNAWQDLTGIDFVAQAQMFSCRERE